jgi:hypothetical protein
MFEYRNAKPSLLDRLERKFGWLAIPRLPIILLGGQAFFTAFGLSDPLIGLSLRLDPARVAAGEWWRLITFVMIPNTTPMGLAFAFFWFSFFWFVCQSLEAQWGAFKTSLYILTGWLSQILVSLLAWGLWRQNLVQEGQNLFLSLQLAFAVFFPDYVIYVFFILPLRMRTVSWIAGAFLLYKALTGWPYESVAVAASMLNYLLFFAAGHARAVKDGHQSGLARAAFSRKQKEAQSRMQARQCRDCGKDPNQAELRLCTCSRCGEEGSFWCLEHLKPHLAA